jgi:predicted ATPase
MKERGTIKMAHEIFISYSTKDKRVADAVCASLEEAGLHCWIAPRDIRPGEDWPSAIVAAIAASRLMVLIFSASSNESPEVPKEVNLALGAKVIVVPFKLDDVSPHGALQYYLAGTHWLDALDGPTEINLRQLVATVRSLTPAEVKTVPASASSPTPGVEGATTSAHRQTNLPAQLTSFVGREQEMAEIEQLLGETRLLTLIGAGGCGKTRLAIQVGASLAVDERSSDGRHGPPHTSAYPDGVWLVELAPLSDPGPLTHTVAAVFGLQTMSRSPLTVLTDYLVDRQPLLILDNCEHLIDACAELASLLLQACPLLRLLATSREALNIPGEVAWVVPPLAVEKAVQLFVDRARVVKPGFGLTVANRSGVVRICMRLDDMPLAIELAAARMRTFSVDQLAARMDDVFRLLTGGSRTALPRQQTLRATIEWSYHLLPEEERSLLRGLSVFAGGWTLEAAEAIHGDGVLERLDQLVNKSLVVANVDEVVGGTRYRLLETIRQYASEAATRADADADADEYKAIRQRHLEYFADLAQAGLLNMEGGIWEWIWKSVVAVELDNTRAALSWAATSGEWQLGWRLIRGALGVWTMLGYGDELARWIETIVLSNPASSAGIRCDILTVMGRLRFDKGDAVNGIVCYREASELAHQLSDGQLLMEANQFLGFLTPDYEQATALLTGVIQLAHQAGYKSRESWALSDLGTRLRMQGNLEGASSALIESLRLARETSDPGIIAIPLLHLGKLYMDKGDPARALVAIEEGIALTRERGLQGWLGILLADLAEVGLRLSDHALVRSALKEHIPLHQRMDSLERVAQGLSSAAGLAQSQDQLQTATRLLGAASAIRSNQHAQGIFESDLFREYDRRLPVLRAALAPTDFERAWTEGLTMTMNQGVEYALQV